RLRLLGEIPVVHARGRTEHHPRRIERLARAQIDRARDAAFDHVRRRILIDVDACHQLRRYVFEAETTRVTRTEHIASVELATNLRHASDHDAAPLRGEAIGVVWGEQVIDRDTRNAL